jgi:hypothetical protein
LSLIQINEVDVLNQRIIEIFGFIIITDKHTGDKVHMPDCSFVKESSFLKKVKDNKEENGMYYWTSNLIEALEKSNGWMVFVL